MELNMHPYKRSARVSDLIKEEVADIIMHKLKDPRLGFITVTEARVSDDLRHANIYVSIFEDAKKDETLKILTSSVRFIRSELGRRVKIKFIPELVFKLDESIEYGARINRIFKELESSKISESTTEKQETSFNDDKDLN
jgi:ribosome-binding factor A